SALNSGLFYIFKADFFPSIKTLCLFLWEQESLLTAKIVPFTLLQLICFKTSQTLLPVNEERTLFAEASFRLNHKKLSYSQNP
ncbi:hypothetical protein P6709_20190, partial [Jeotgalibacillus sp. ET6]|uniref:hypothetical protein n=1 Tax=Jeotgalibacillus sp. ET6 TaxID=3037260 RepID=UPI0024184157